MVAQTSFQVTATPELLDWLCGIYPVQTGFSHKSGGLSPDNTERIIELECGLSRRSWRRHVLNASPSPGSKEGDIPLGDSSAEKDEEELKLEEEPADESELLKIRGPRLAPRPPQPLSSRHHRKRQSSPELPPAGRAWLTVTSSVRPWRWQQGESGGSELIANGATRDHGCN